MSAHIDDLTGTIQFRVEGQAALPKWQQSILQNALRSDYSPPNALRFQCRIATDARVAFERIDLGDGESLTMHPKAKPQFGKNDKGHAYLTTTMVYSKDGQSYRISWVGDAVPLRMKQVAVSHDEGKAVKATVVPLDLGAATVLPAYLARGRKSRQEYNTPAKKRARAKYASKGKPKVSATPKHCARLTAADLAA